MAVIHTVSATPLERITIEAAPNGGAHVWLRCNIVDSVAEFESSTVPIWEADEVYSRWDEAPSIDEIEADFAVLWAAGAQDGIEDTWRTDVEVALAELADLLVGGE